MAISDTERLRSIAYNPRTPINTRGALLDAATEIERLRHEREQLAKAIRDAAVKAGICREDVPLTGPDLMMLCMDMGVALTANDIGCAAGVSPSERTAS